MLKRLCVSVLFSLLLVGCADTLERDVEDLVRAKNLWIANASGKDYEYTIAYSECFCRWRGKKIRVIVSAGTVVAAQLLTEQASGEVVDPRSFQTIRGHFETIFATLKDRAEGNESLEIEVTYDQSLGFPNEVYRNVKGVFDSNVRFNISEVRFRS